MESNEVIISIRMAFNEDCSPFSISILENGHVQSTSISIVIIVPGSVPVATQEVHNFCVVLDACKIVSVTRDTPTFLTSDGDRTLIYADQHVPVATRSHFYI